MGLIKKKNILEPELFGKKRLRTLKNYNQIIL